MFRKLITLSVLLFLWAGTSMARPCPPHFSKKPYHSPVKVVHYSHHSDGMFWAGLVGSAVGSFLAVSSPQPVITAEKVKCMVLKSRLTGEITKKCVSSDSFYEIKRDVYDVLYVE